MCTNKQDNWHFSSAEVIMFTNWVRIIKIIYINLKYKSTWKKRYHKKSSTKKKKKLKLLLRTTAVL